MEDIKHKMTGATFICLTILWKIFSTVESDELEIKDTKMDSKKPSNIKNRIQSI